MSGDTIKYRIDPGLGVIDSPGNPTIVYMVDGERISWARHLGEASTLELTAELSAAIWSNHECK